MSIMFDRYRMMTIYQSLSTLYALYTKAKLSVESRHYSSKEITAIWKSFFLIVLCVGPLRVVNMGARRGAGV